MRSTHRRICQPSQERKDNFISEYPFSEKMWKASEIKLSFRASATLDWQDNPAVTSRRKNPRSRGA